ncbi:MAG: cell wall-binding repeat-containing protein [Microbacterium sp.]|nr:cell wall-binding repeat-containing protein [Microbacterium sp.]
MNGPAKASLVGFSAGNIISNAVFTDSSTMTEAQIQAFFNSKVKACQSGYTCLKDFRITSVTRPADTYCKGYTGAANETAARIIYRVSKACNINPQVLIVMLQKEQGLVTHTWPSQWRYDKALGQGCPDTAPCDPKFVGFFHQIYGAARQMNVYMEGKYFTWYAPGKTWNILYNPNTKCGSSPVYVANKATAALYYYTPYQPNAAALRAGYGTGDSCSAYGNRNFYNYFTDWFGSTQLAAFSSGSAKITGTAAVGQTLSVAAQFTPAPTSVAYQWYRNGTVITGATGVRYVAVSADRGANLSVKATAKRTGYKDVVATSAAVAVKGVSVDRLWGASREDTAIAVSRAAWPSGTSTVYLATSMSYADALSASAIAAKNEASMLLSPANGLPAAVSNEIKRLGPTRVVLMGGEGVLSSALAKQVAALVPGSKIDRYGGADRYATSRAVVESGGASAEVLLATGLDFPDALSAAAAGSINKTPVLMVNGRSGAMDAATLATIKKIGATKITIVGGTGVVSAGIEQQAKQQGLAVTRLSGADRYQTNVAVNSRYFPTTALKALIASGADFPDALSASALAGRWGVPLLLSQPTCIPRVDGDFMLKRGTEAVTLVGGPGVLSDAGVAQMRACA